jgi:hypothetical protein
MKTHTLRSITFSENRVFYEVMPIWRMLIAGSLPKVKNTHSDFVTLNASPLQQSFHKFSSLTCYTYIAFPVIAETASV